MRITFTLDLSWFSRKNLVRLARSLSNWVRCSAGFHVDWASLNGRESDGISSRNISGGICRSCGLARRSTAAWFIPEKRDAVQLKIRRSVVGNSG